ncbi:S8 family serine peptidase (plasmid) [Aliirhizobium terrae]|uniref:S8 family serine peptidase n=1 Tax=Terrirhizobium terrae TaxID=2926709 RepID=UPI0025778BFD|nr:S8 family serine peptidase [Rhizobium sp. CC-CFT758]WJH37698.1 S8 family serine peptidase [Rhizobium sp. CC-CFT758]
MKKTAPYRLRFFIVILAGLGGVITLPVLQSAGIAPGITSAFADDDDDGGGDDGDDGSGGGYGGGSSGGGGGDDNDTRRPRGDLRSLFGWPFQRAERRSPPRRTVSVPDRAPNEIVALGLDETTIANLTQDGFVVDERISISLTGSEMVKLTIPTGMTLDVARQAVIAAAPSASVDFNHFYQPEQKKTSPCPGGDCKLVRHIVDWPQDAGDGRAASCGAPMPIGLIDTAINAGHASLADATIEVLQLGDGAAPTSTAQHGTAVAALLVGSAGSRAPGLVPGGRLVAIDAFQRYRKAADIADIYDLIRALDMLAARNIRIINLSLSGPPNMLLEQAVSATIAKGTILIAAAGNEGPNAKPVYPAAYADVIAVTAVDRNMKPYRRASRGDHIDIAAPGVGVWTAASISGGRQKSGTSFAAPFVTAAASLLLGAKPDMKPGEVADALTRSANDMGEPGKDAIFGWGLLNAKALCQI